MALVINTNLASLNARRNLDSSQKTLSTSLQRLSSGTRINSARDDAAGMAISERFTTQIRGMNQAMRNANDAISLTQTVESAMGEIGNNLQRIRELSVQARNATNSSSDRQALQTEASQLKSEIQRVATQTDFNGTKLLDGTFSQQAFQVGANVGDTINIASIANANIANLGTWRPTDADNFVAHPLVGTQVGADILVGDISNFSLNTTNTTELEAKEDLMGKVATFLSQHVSISANFDENTGDLTVTNTWWANINVGLSQIGGSDAALSIGQSLVLNIDDMDVPIVNELNRTNTGFADLDITTVEGADDAILAMDAALESINSARAYMGAVQNRFESVMSNVQTSAENLSDARSRILDTDFATETAALTRGQILQQASTAILSQANTLPQNVLSLLQG
jgi:flagellin